ncbi:nuclear transport factor 2 family protein [Celerinatantimonas yamalensis]|uniref:Nuclear transport factor 2 family protein n=1 Tax=Celerinatantimonas yamalensis TaxID=559956 RepID=A0ABW9G6A6_9GAMM
MNTNTLVLNAFKEIIESPLYDKNKLTHYFSSDYKQVVNGNLLDFDGFIKHVERLKTETKNMTLTVIASAAEGDTVFTHHNVVVEKEDGELTLFEVLANFTVSNSKIVRCEELTRVIQGTDSDQDLGHRH